MTGRRLDPFRSYISRIESVYAALPMNRIGLISLILMMSPGCVVVGGYSSERGFFLWPGTIVIFVVVVVLFLLLRRRK